MKPGEPGSLSLQYLSGSVHGFCSIKVFVSLFTGPLCVVGHVFLLKVYSICSAFANALCGGSGRKYDYGFLTPRAAWEGSLGNLFL